MPFYKAIRNDTETGRRTASNLLTLRTELDIRIPSRTVDSTLLLATWNTGVRGQQVRRQDG